MYVQLEVVYFTMSTRDLGVSGQRYKNYNNNLLELVLNFSA